MNDLRKLIVKARTSRTTQIENMIENLILYLPKAFKEGGLSKVNEVRLTIMELLKIRKERLSVLKDSWNNQRFLQMSSVITALKNNDPAFF